MHRGPRRRIACMVRPSRYPCASRAANDSRRPTTRLRCPAAASGATAGLRRDRSRRARRRPRHRRRRDRRRDRGAAGRPRRLRRARRRRGRIRRGGRGRRVPRRPRAPSPSTISTASTCTSRRRSPPPSRSGAPLAISVEIENSTAEALAPGTVRLTRADVAIDEHAANSMRGSAPRRGSPVQPVGEPCCCSRASRARSPRVRPRSCRSRCPANALGDRRRRGRARPRRRDRRRRHARRRRHGEAFATSTAPASDPTSLALADPLTVPAGSAGIFTADAARREWTAPLGLLDATARCGRRRAASRSASTRASSPRSACWARAAPAVGHAWLAAARRRCTNEVFPLAYADADVAVQAQLELPELLDADARSPTCSTPANVHRRRAAAADPTDDADAHAHHRPTARRAEPTTRPTRRASCRPPSELLDWPYTRTDIAWPADDTVAVGDLGYFDAAGLTTAIVAPGNVEPIDGRPMPSSAHRGSTASSPTPASRRPCAPHPTASTDDRMALRRPGSCSPSSRIDAGSSRPRDDARDVRPRRRLATPTGSPRRSTSAIGNRAGRRSAGLSDAIGAPPVARVLVDQPEDDQRRHAAAERMIAVEAEVTEFATVLDDPAVAHRARCGASPARDARRGLARRPRRMEHRGQHWLTAPARDPRFGLGRAEQQRAGRRPRDRRCRRPC